MPLFRVSVTRTVYLEAEIEADDAEEASEEARSGGANWKDATGGRGLGDDDYVVTGVEQIEEEGADDESGM